MLTREARRRCTATARFGESRQEWGARGICTGPLYNAAMDAEKIVLEFCNAVPSRDVALLVGFFSEDAVYHNIPIAPVTGRAEIEKTLNGFLAPASDAEFEVLAIASRGNVVLTERVDRFTIGDKRIELPVMGTFEVDAEGKISAWRDYFDMAQFTAQMS